ncbi:MAG TPA: hypothetical protein VFI73_07415 [Candidatus Nitrosopolaris sp.]|nr:hypothetical protein [Candidatus Nitrosopolaris sp.]
MAFGSKASVNIIEILTNLPDFLREPILRRKLKEFYIFDESDKRETIAMALSAVSSIQAEKLFVLAKTWMVVLSEFDTSRIVIMLRLYCEEILKDHSLIEKLNIDCLIHAFMSLEEVKKQKFIDCLKEAMLSVPYRHKLIELMPPVAIRILDMK